MIRLIQYLTQFRQQFKQLLSKIVNLIRTALKTRSKRHFVWGIVIWARSKKSSSRLRLWLGGLVGLSIFLFVFSLLSAGVATTKILLNAGFLVGTLLLIGLSLAGYFGQLNYNLELTSHFKVQYLLLSLIPCCFFLLSRYPIGLLLSLFCVLINLVEVLPWCWPQRLLQLRNRTNHLNQMRIFQANINKHNWHYAQILEAVESEQPEIAVLLEVTEYSAKALERLQTEFPYVFAHHDIYDGIVIYSKLPLINPQIQSLGGGRAAVLVNLKLKDQTVLLVAVHPSNAVGKFYSDERNRQLVAIAEFVKTCQQPVILVGDFNTTVWSPYYKRSLGSTSLRNACKGFGIMPTWMMLHAFFAIPIDHCLISSEFQVAQTRTGRAIGSDHLPLVTDLLY